MNKLVKDFIKWLRDNHYEHSVNTRYIYLDLLKNKIGEDIINDYITRNIKDYYEFEDNYDELQINYHTLMKALKEEKIEVRPIRSSTF